MNFSRLLQPRDDRPPLRGHPRVARSEPGRVHRPGPRLDGDRAAPLRLCGRGVPQAPRDGRVRAARHPPGDRDAPRADHRGPLLCREPVHPLRERGRQPAGVRHVGRGLRGPPPVRVARARIHPRERPQAEGRTSPTGTRSCASRCPGIRVADPKACQCGEVLRGALKPWECKVFGTACTPETPIGTCMVSAEGACAAYYNFGRLAPRGGASAMGAAR